MIEQTGRLTYDEVKNLEYGMDFREPKYRREVLLRFYEFHLRCNSHPGGVYFAMPWLANFYAMDEETKLWIAFINGCSQNIVSTWLIWNQFPDLHSTRDDKLNSWWNENQHHFKAGSGWDSDRKYFKVGKTGFPACVESYRKAVQPFGSQEGMFNSLTGPNQYRTFAQTWTFVRDNFLSFGRLSTFSYLEYLKIQGRYLDCNSLFLDDVNGSKSHRNGLCKVCGRDDLDWNDAKDSNNPNFEGYSEPIIEWLTDEGAILLNDAKTRINHKDVSYFTLESTLCCYKSWHRPNRRYPNIYMDMMYNRIKYAEGEWPKIGFSLFWEMRKSCLPKNLRLEDNWADPGLVQEKQNHYRNTGEVIMMDQVWPCFKNAFNDKIHALQGDL